MDGAADVDSAELAAGGAVVDGALGVEDPQATSDTPQSAAPTRIRADRGLRRDPALIILTPVLRTRAAIGRVNLAECSSSHAEVGSAGETGGHRGPVSDTEGGSVATIEDVRAVASLLPRSYEVVVRDRVKFRVGQLVYLAFSRDGSLMGFAFPKLERDALIAAEPDRFLLPKPGDLRYNWIVVRLERIDAEQVREIVLDAWQMVVPKRVARAYLGPVEG